MSFAAAAFLLGFATLALPWWLHRRRSRPPQARVVASLQHMEPSPAPQDRHRTLSHRWLLAGRCLLLAAAVTAFAQPLLPRAPGASAAAMPRMLPRLIVLDTSLSMDAGIEAARATARSLIDELPPGTPAALVAAGSELDLVAAFTDDRRALEAALAGVAPDGSHLTFESLLERSAALGSGAVDGRLEVHLISDFQQTAMPARFNGLLPETDHPVVLHPVAGAAGNRALVSLTIDNDQAVAAIRRFGAGADTATVVLTADGREVGRQRVAVTAGADGQAAFRLPADAEDVRRWQASFTTRDELPADDTVYAAVNPRDDVPLPVFTQPEGSAPRTYLMAALEAAEPGYRAAGEDARGPVAVLLDPGDLDPVRERRLARHLEEGGSLFITAGPATERAGRLAVVDLPLVPDRLDRVPRGVTVETARHPLFVPGHDGDAVAPQWRDVRVNHLVVPDGVGAAEVLVATESGVPVLLDLPLGAGRALVLTTALDPEWSNLVASPVFVRLVADALAYLGEDLVPTAARVGERMVLPAAGIQVFDAGGAAMLELQDTVSRGGFRVRQPGIYELRTPNRSRLLAVNADARESDPRPAEPALLERWQAAVGRVATPPAPASGQPEPALWPLAPWLLGLLLIAAALEMLAANLSRPELARGPEVAHG